MSKSKYKADRKITTVRGFENATATWYKWNGKTVHRSILESQQYRTLKLHLNKGCIYTAKKVGE